VGALHSKNVVAERQKKRLVLGPTLTSLELPSLTGRTGGGAPSSVSTMRSTARSCIESEPTSSTLHSTGARPGRTTTTFVA
jgi:hypothetical protein